MKPAPTGIEEVVALENAIRAFLRKGKDKVATEIMRGRPAAGTRLDALKEIVHRLKIAVDV